MTNITEAALAEILTWVVIPTDEGEDEVFPVDTAEEISLAEAALAAAGLSSARVWSGEGVDAVATAQTLFASETDPDDSGFDQETIAIIVTKIAAAHLDADSAHGAIDADCGPVLYRTAAPSLIAVDAEEFLDGQVFEGVWGDWDDGAVLAAFCASVRAEYRRLAASSTRLVTVTLPHWSGFRVSDEDQGQTVEYAYARADAGTVLLRIRDASDRSESFAVADLDESESEWDGDGEPAIDGEWVSCLVLIDED